MKRLLSIITLIIITVSVCGIPVHAAADYESAAENAVINYNRSVPLEVKGNKIVEQGTDNMVVLRGVNVPSLGWGMAEHIYESMTTVYDNWHANLIRLPIQPKYWFNGSDYLSSEQYQKYIDDAVKAAQARGKYIILDCHTYVMPLEESLKMWSEVAEKYKNNSAVLFGLLNEPHDIKPAGSDAGRSAWDVWRNGGQITINGNEVRGVGHQELLEAIRETGADNICIAGGLDWAFDISGLADGYDGLENGYRLADTASGNGVMYDSHAYPVKGTISRWNEILGPVRKAAPILIGEWGWDSSDNAISGGDGTSNIWMNQLMSWMDDEYGEYDGIPVNWTGWNLHMASSPRMIYSWDFKTYAFNGTYIKKRLQGYCAEPEKQDGVYSTDFSSDGVFRSYTGQNGKAAVKYSAENKNVVINHQADEWSSKLDFPYDWDLNGIQTITMDISSDVTETVNIGLYGADMEVWTVPVQINSGVKTVTVRIDELEKQGNPLTDGILDGALSGIYFGAVSAAEGNITVDNIKIVKLKEPVFTAKAYPHKDTGAECYIDIDTDDFEWEYKSSSTIETENVTVSGADGKDTAAKLITSKAGGGAVQYYLKTAPSMKTKYFTLCMKGSGVEQKISVNLGNLAVYNTTIDAGDTDWHQYIYCLDGLVEYPEDIEYVKLSSSANTYFYADNFGFSVNKPKRTVSGPGKIFVYDFAAYNKNTSRYEAKISTIDGGEGDAITARKVDGGLDLTTKALEISYKRGGTDKAAKALVVYSSPNFFSGNVNDDPRTAERSKLKANMEFMEDLIIHGKSTSGKNERINVGVIDAANGMTTYTTERSITLTPEWKQFRIPLDEFKVLDGGKPIEYSRVRGFVFSAAKANTKGSFMIDNITQTDIRNVEMVVETPAPKPEPRIIANEEEFKAALANKEWSVYKLADDITLTDAASAALLVEANSFDLDLDGHTINLGSSYLQFEQAGKFCFDNGTIISASTGTKAVFTLKQSISTELYLSSLTVSAGVEAVYINTEGQTLTAENCNFSNTIAAGSNGVINATSGTVTISNSDITYHSGTQASFSGIRSSQGNPLFILNNVNITPTDASSAGRAFAITAGAGTAEINGGAYKGINCGVYFNSSGKININDADISYNQNNNKDAAGGSVYLGKGSLAMSGTTRLNYDGTDNRALNKAAETTTVITGGTYPFDPTEYLDPYEDYDFSVNEDGTYTVTLIPNPDPPPPSDVYIYDITQFDENNITVEVTVPEETSEGDIMYVATYIEDRLCGVYVVTDIKEKNTFASHEGAEEVRVFIWNENMVPVAEKKQQ